MSSTSWECWESSPEHMAKLERHFRGTIPATPYAHTRIDSGEVAGAGEQFRPPGSQTSWPRHVEIAPEDLEFQHSAAGDLAVEMLTTPRQHLRRIGRTRGDSRAFSCPSMPQGYSSEDVASLVTQRDRARVEATQSGPCIKLSLWTLHCVMYCVNSLGAEKVESWAPNLIEAPGPPSAVQDTTGIWLGLLSTDRSSEYSSESETDVSVSYGSSTLTSEDDDDESANAHTPTQDNRTPLNASRPSTPEPHSYSSTEDGHGHPEQDLVLSSPPWSTQKRKRVDSPDGDNNE
ncbi:hypothetical protein HBH98_029830 [Parastagonospora nodorum]|nr:hypothetical protein HBH49_048730 [Parastagonospora nodorum]KAH4217286.1 hypothetical protein HBI06_218490 [Parastagonospora nodorum]KAH4228738.1 hypothetical protein HBI05_201490 [Parastagonospora nodorum]KAH4309686.1 hypothetical protein HBI01_038900 [Parastagonospora nodorum]KAH4314898.1 hypothetical protein HBI02_059880 [Parastagonospora nodorum]